jgi:hypothetical protein
MAKKEAKADVSAKPADAAEAPQPKYRDCVIYTERGKQFNALVVKVRTDLESHLGENDEPMLDLVMLSDEFDDPEKQAFALHNHRAGGGLIMWRHDVVHESHQFTEEEQKEHGKVYAGGRWK